MASNISQDRMEVYYRPPLSPELVRNAQLVVCGLASNVEDAAMLLDVLNLKGASTKELHVTGDSHSSNLDDPADGPT
jgi:malonyl CoA-acyl carrier protein transacylase